MWPGKEHKDSPDQGADHGAADGPLAHSQAAPAQPRHVGMVLRRAREAQNEELRIAAAHLRIRDFYLRAIEDGRFDELPAGAYAVGFVRAYAVHLGLDGDKLVRRFKEELGTGARKPNLVIPLPQPENRVPGGALVMASLLLAAGAYGGWYFVSGSSRVAEAPSVPEPPRAVASAPAQTALPATGGLDTSIAAPPRGTTAVPAPAAQSAAQPQTPAAVASAAPALGRAQAPTQQPAQQPARQPAPDADEADSTPAPTPLRPSAKTPETIVEAASQAQPEPPLPRPAISASAASAATIDAAQAPAKPKPRVVIRAVADSWLQIGDGRGPSLFAQVLRAGDSFTVPADRAGLRFDTGNAGGLEITVDGQVVPPLGPSGAVRRNIPLDADKLVAGAHH
jgi:cytoskeleton protein RodZ